MEVRQKVQPRNLRQLTDLVYDAGLDTVRLARIVEVSSQHISAILRGRTTCSPRVATAIATALDTPVEELFRTGRLSGFLDATRRWTPMTVIDLEAEIDHERLHRENPILLFEEVCVITRIKPKTMRKIHARREGPPFTKPGKRLRCRYREVMAWLETYDRPADE